MKLKRVAFRDQVSFPLHGRTIQTSFIPSIQIGSSANNVSVSLGPNGVMIEGDDQVIVPLTNVLWMLPEKKVKETK